MLVQRKLMIQAYPLIAGLGGALALFSSAATRTEAGLPPERPAPLVAQACMKEIENGVVVEVCTREPDPARELLATISAGTPLDESERAPIFKLKGELQ